MSMTLTQLLAQYRADHETGIAESTMACWYLPAVSCLRRHIGREPTIADLNQATINGWLDRLREDAKPQATIKTRRAAIMTLWRFAVEEDLAQPPKKVRKVKLLPRNPVAWSPAEVAQLIETARTHEGAHKKMRFSGVPTGVYFAALICVAWDTALRLGDLMRLRPCDVQRCDDGSGRLLITQHKTGYIVQCRISAESMQLLDECIGYNPDRALIWPTKGTRRRGIYQRIKKFVELAGITQGTLRFVRRGAATAAEAVPGAGTVLLGHRSRQTTVQSYLDQTKITASAIVLPSVVRPRTTG